MTTVVSCFYKIPSKHDLSSYMVWIQNFMSLKTMTVIYVNTESHNLLYAMYPETPSRKYVIKEFYEFITYEYDWLKDQSIDHEANIGHNSLLYMIWNEKPFFLQDAMNKNVYNTEYYMWVDIGCFRDSSLLPSFKGFPNHHKMNKDKLQFLQVKPFTSGEMVDIKNFDNRFRYVDRIGGTMFTCHKKNVNIFADLHRSALSAFSSKGLFKGKDQSLFAFHVLQNPSLFELITKPSDTESRNSEWFYLQDYLSGHIHIAIVGPGIMPIPPHGWGAVEILIWDYAQTLMKMGYTVTIVNDKDVKMCIRRLCQIKPDIVHIQYDDRAHIAAAVRDFVRAVLITSHYGYLEQTTRWDSGYKNIFQDIIRQTHLNVYHAVLSEGIACVYRKFGVPDSNIIVTPNGANHELFEYTEAPMFADRSIYLAKIDARKRQHLFQTIDSLYYAGNIADTRFNRLSPNYLGEWSKDYLYKNLTQYGNLVLLSDGEADPLVVKEALIAGLGLVISEWAIAGLDVTKPYITVIPENRLLDLAYVESEIRKNREISSKMRHDIREYGLGFSWATLIDKYSIMINRLCRPKDASRQN